MGSGTPSSPQGPTAKMRSPLLRLLGHSPTGKKRAPTMVSAWNCRAVIDNFYLVDMSAVPSKVRQRITDDVRRGWRQGDFERLRSWRGGDDLALNLAPKH